MNTLIAQYQFWTIVAGCWILSAAVWLLQDPAPSNNPAYLRLYRVNAAINGAATTLLLLFLARFL